MLQIFLIFQVIIAVCIIALVMVQHGKGADMGATFGAGASGTVFGSSGSAPFLVKITVFFAVLFFVNSLSIGYMTMKSKRADAKANTSLLTSPTPISVNPVSSVPQKAMQQKKNKAVKTNQSSSEKGTNSPPVS